MRFALRNQAKIEKAFGGDTLEMLMDSLRQAFEGFTDFELQARIDHTATPYPALTVDYTAFPYGMAIFYVIGRQYDVLHLAFKEINNK